MHAAIAGSLMVLAAYLAGSIPFGFLAGKLFRGVDIRQHGSCNIGATNVARVLGKKLGAAVLLLDALKGLLPVWLLPELFARWTDAPAAVRHVQVACGVATVLGHMFPCWLGFRGGKGVATALGVASIQSWAAMLAAATVFVVLVTAFRIVSLASMLAAVGFAAAYFLLQEAPFSVENWSLSAFSLAVPALILFRHRKNIVRLCRGEEPRFGTAPQPVESNAESGPSQ